MRITSNFSEAALKARSVENTFKTLTVNTFWPRILYLAKLSTRQKGRKKDTSNHSGSQRFASLAFFLRSLQKGCASFILKGRINPREKTM